MFFFIGNTEVFQSTNAPASLVRAARLRSAALRMFFSGVMAFVGIMSTIIGVITCFDSLTSSYYGPDTTGITGGFLLVLLGVGGIVGGWAFITSTEKLMNLQADIIDGHHRGAFVTSNNRSFRLAFTPGTRAFLLQGLDESNETLRTLSNLLFEHEVIEADQTIFNKSRRLVGVGEAFEAEFMLIRELMTALASAPTALLAQLETRRVVLTKDFSEWIEDSKDTIEYYQKSTAALNL